MRIRGRGPIRHLKNFSGESTSNVSSTVMTQSATHRRNLLIHKGITAVSPISTHPTHLPTDDIRVEASSYDASATCLPEPSREA